MEIARETSFGPVKFTWKHGEGGLEPRKMRVTKEDIGNFPRLLREYIPSLNEQGGYRWVIQAPGGRWLRYVAKNFADTDGKSHLVTADVITKGQANKDGVSKKIADLVSSQEGLVPSRKVPRGALANQTFAPSRASLGQEAAIRRSGGYTPDPTGAAVKAVDPFRLEISGNSRQIRNRPEALAPPAPTPNAPNTPDAISPTARFLANALRELGILPERGPEGVPRPDALPALPPGPAADAVARALELVKRGEAHPAYAGEFNHVYAAAMSEDGLREGKATPQDASGSDIRRRPENTPQGAGAPNEKPSRGQGGKAAIIYGELPPLAVSTKQMKRTASIDKTFNSLSEHCSRLSKHGITIRISKENPPKNAFMATYANGKIVITPQQVFLGPTIGTHDLSKTLHLGWNRLAEGNTLTLPQESAMQILWHEMLHQRQYGLIWLKGRFSEEYEIILETFVEWTARRTYKKFLTTLGTESGFQRSIERYGQGYYDGVNNFGILLRMLAIEEDSLTSPMLNMIERIPEDLWCKAIMEMIYKKNQMINKDDIVKLLKSIYAPNFVILLKEKIHLK